VKIKNPFLPPCEGTPEHPGSAGTARVIKPLPHDAELLTVAKHVIWFEPPERALADPARFLTYLMTYGTAEEIEVVRRYLDLDDFRAALEQAPPGIMDERSWAYWNVMTGRDPIPPMPQRVIP
jgi:hypothetical protein